MFSETDLISGTSRADRLRVLRRERVHAVRAGAHAVDAARAGLDPHEVVAELVELAERRLVPARPIETTQITVATATVMPRIASAARTLLRPSERMGSMVIRRTATRTRNTTTRYTRTPRVKRP